MRKISFPITNILKMSIQRSQTSFKNWWQSLTLLHPVKLNEWMVIIKIGLTEKYLKNLGQGTNSLKRSKKRGFISIKNYIKRLNTTHKSQSQQKRKHTLMKNSESFGKPKEVWNILKTLGMPKKMVVPNFMQWLITVMNIWHKDNVKSFQRFLLKFSWTFSS